MNLLVIMPTKYLGNMVIALQAITALMKGDDDHVTLLIDEAFAPLLGHVFDSRHFICYPRRKAGISGYLRFIGDLRRTRYDIALDIDGTVLSGRITRLARAGQKIGPGFAKRTGVYSTLVPVDRDSQHCFDDYALMARHLGRQVEPRAYLQLPKMPTGVWDLPDPGRHVACIHPCATKDYKQWDIAKFAGLADNLILSGWSVVIVGAGAAEAGRISDLLGLMKEVPTNLHGRLDLTQLVYLLQHSGVFIGNDSGPMHLAAAAGVNVLALFGPTELLRWEPMAGKVAVIRGELPCSPDCQPEACLRNYQCLRSLSVDQVLAAVDRLN